MGPLHVRQRGASERHDALVLEELQGGAIPERLVGADGVRVLATMGRRITMFWQVVLAWLACWAFLPQGYPFDAKGPPNP